MTWHADVGMIDAYLRDRLDPARAASVETHLTTCGTCRASLATQHRRDQPAADRHAASWTALAERIDRPRFSPLEGLLLRCGVPEHVTRMVAASELTRAWWLAGVMALAFAAVLAQFGSEAAGVSAFVVLSPVVPVAGIIFAYGATGEPAYEISVVAPYPSLRRALVRSVTVMACWLPPAAAFTLVLPGDVPLVIWLLPALAMCSLTLALATVTTPVRAGCGLAVAWLVFAGSSVRGTSRYDAAAVVDGLPYAHITGQWVLVAVCVTALAVAVIRRSSFERIATL